MTKRKKARADVKAAAAPAAGPGLSRIAAPGDRSTTTVGIARTNQPTNRLRY